MQNSQFSCELSILMPCLNEAETLSTCIEKAQTFLAHNQVPGEIIVADNGSTDSSVRIAENAGARLVNVSEKGYGAALMGGIAAARGKYIIMGDADDSYDFSNLQPFLDRLRAGDQLVMGNRFKGGIKPGAMPFLHRYLGNPVLSGIGRLFFKSKIGDFHCGLRGFEREAILGLELRTTGMEFASEMIVKATLNNLRISEVPTILYPDGRSRRPHLRTWHDGWRHLRFLFLYSPRWLFLFPGIVITTFGMLFFIWLLPGPRTIGTVTLDIASLMYAAMLILIGIQAVTFAVFTKVFGIREGLLPRDSQLEFIMRKINLENGIVFALLCIGGGLTSSILALLYWNSRSFGALDPSVSMRLVIPGAVLSALGFQFFLSSFFLSILELKRK